MLQHLGQVRIRLCLFTLFDIINSLVIFLQFFLFCIRPLLHHFLKIDGIQLLRKIDALNLPNSVLSIMRYI